MNITLREVDIDNFHEVIALHVVVIFALEYYE